MTVRTIESNDSGVGFVVEADGVVIFHPGDHANRVAGTLEGYREEIDRLAAALREANAGRRSSHERHPARTAAEEDAHR